MLSGPFWVISEPLGIRVFASSMMRPTAACGSSAAVRNASGRRGGRSWRSGCVLAHPSPGELVRRAEPHIIVGAQQATLVGNSGV